MDPTRVWPLARAEWIVHEDDDVIIVDKPVGVSTGAESGRGIDLATRLGGFLGQRDGATDERAYLGTHQHLERELSGLVIYAKTRRANPGLARQFERRAVTLHYQAVVGDVRRTRGQLPGGGRIREEGRQGSRALISIETRSASTQRLRAELAKIGRLVGDPAHGGSQAPRMLLHRSGLGLEHPVDGTPLRVRTGRPAELELSSDPAGASLLTRPEAFRRVLGHALERRYALGRAMSAPRPTTAFRLLHGEGEAVPGVAVDVYGNHLVLHLFGPEPAASRDLLLDALDELGFDGIYVKLHPKQANTLGHERRDDLAPPEPLRGEAAPDEITVREHGVPYRVRLGDGLATGLFLDQRENRLRVGELAKHRRVLNLFSYCGAFGNATASGGATQVVQVDASGPALARAREAAARFGWADRMELVQADAFAFLEAAARRGERFDVVIADPPTYSTTRSSRWRSGTDWRRLIEACLSVAARGAHIVVSSNDRRLNHKKLRRYAHEAARRAGRRTGRVKDLSPPVDFPPDPHGEPPLKALHWVVER